MSAPLVNRLNEFLFCRISAFADSGAEEILTSHYLQRQDRLPATLQVPMQTQTVIFPIWRFSKTTDLELKITLFSRLPLFTGYFLMYYRPRK